MRSPSAKIINNRRGQNNNNDNVVGGVTHDGGDGAEDGSLQADG